MNNKNITKNKANRLGMIVVAIAATAIIAITPAMVVSVQAEDAGDDAAKADEKPADTDIATIGEILVVSDTNNGRVVTDNDKSRADSPTRSDKELIVQNFEPPGDNDDKSNQGECGVNMSCEPYICVCPYDDNYDVCGVADHDTQTSHNC